MKPNYIILRMGLAFCLFFSARHSALSQHESTVIGSISNSLAQINTDQKGPWSAYNQTTEMVTDTAWQFGCFVGNPYLLNNYRTYGLSLVNGYKNMAFGVCLKQSGYSIHNQLSTVCAFALKLNTKLQLGSALHLDQTRIKGLETLHKPKIVLDAQFYITHKNVVYVRLFNPVIEDMQSRYVATYITTLKHQVTEKTNLYLQADIASANTGNLKVGLSHFTSQQFQVLVGVGTQPQTVSFGFGLRIDKTSIHVANAYHPSLGFTPSCSAEFVKP